MWQKERDFSLIGGGDRITLKYGVNKSGLFAMIVNEDTKEVMRLFFEDVPELLYLLGAYEASITRDDHYGELYLQKIKEMLK